MTARPDPPHTPPSSSPRGLLRRAHLSAVFLSTLTTAAAAAVAVDVPGTTKKTRIKGAAEIDAEAYLQDLLRGNPLTGGLEQSPIQVRPARTIDLTFATFLDKATQEQISKVAGLPLGQISKEVAAFRQTVEPGFQRRAPFPSNDLSNERCFDCYTYSDFRVASKLIPNLRSRVSFVQGLGEAVLNEVIAEAREGGNIINPVNAPRDGLEGVIDGLGRILAFMQAKVYIKAKSSLALPTHPPTTPSQLTNPQPTYPPGFPQGLSDRFGRLRPGLVGRRLQHRAPGDGGGARDHGRQHPVYG